METDRVTCDHVDRSPAGDVQCGAARVGAGDVCAGHLPESGSFHCGAPRQVLTIRVAVELLVCPRCGTSGLCEPSVLTPIVNTKREGAEADYSSSQGLPRGWRSLAVVDMYQTASSRRGGVLCAACVAALEAFF